MPFGDRLPNLAIGFGVGVAIALAGTWGLYEYQRRTECEYYSAQPHCQDAPYVGPSVRVSPISKEKGPNPEPYPERKEWREEQDLEAQREQARWALGAMIAAFIGVCVTGIGVVLLWFTLGHTRNAANYARDMVDEAKKTTAAAVNANQAAADANTEAKRHADLAEETYKRLERPYLFIEFATTGKLRKVAPTETASLEYTLVNYGKTPAILRSVAIGLQNNPKFPLITPMAIANTTYGVIKPGEAMKKHRTVEVTGGSPGDAYDSAAATLLILHGYLEYEDPTGAYHFDKFCMRGMVGGTGFQIEGGPECNSRTTTYPQAKFAKT